MDDFISFKTGIHYFLHGLFPFFVAYLFYRKNWKTATVLLLATMLVDVDHLVADPIFDPNRNSVGFHVLHSYPAIAIYALGFVFLKGNYRIICLGLLLHMLTDAQDYYLWH